EVKAHRSDSAGRDGTPGDPARLKPLESSTSEGGPIMASVTLAESAKLAQDELVAGVIENIITVNRMFDVLPFDSIEGNSLAYNRENALGDVIVAGVGTTFSGAGAGKNPATFTRVNSNLTTIMGDAEVNGLIQATR